MKNKFKYNVGEIQPYINPESPRRPVIKGRITDRVNDAKRGIIYQLDPWTFGHYGHRLWVNEEDVGTHVLERGEITDRWDKWPKTIEEMDTYPDDRYEYIWERDPWFGAEAFGVTSKYPNRTEEELSSWISKAKALYVKELESLGL